MTVYLDEIKPGLSESARHTITERDIELFGEATGDMNPIHFDEAVARKSVFRGRVAHGALFVGYISALLGTKLPGAGTIFLGASINFKNPVRIGETVTTTVTVREVQGREAVFDCDCSVDGKVTMESVVRVLVPRRPPSRTA